MGPALQHVIYPEEPGGVSPVLLPVFYWRHNHTPEESYRLTAALSSLKMEHLSPFTGSTGDPTITG